MVRRGSHGADAVVASWKTARDSCAQQTVSVACVVDAFEERKLLWVGRRGRREVVAKRLDGDVRVADDFAVTGEVLRRAIVGGRCVGEGSGLQVLHLYRDGEGGAGFYVVGWLGVGDDGGDHVGCGRDLAHDCQGCQFAIRPSRKDELTDTVARSCLDLQAVSQCLTTAEVDEIRRVPGSISMV